VEELNDHLHKLYQTEHSDSLTKMFWRPSNYNNNSRNATYTKIPQLLGSTLIARPSVTVVNKLTP